jgi:hypothetical protein
MKKLVLALAIGMVKRFGPRDRIYRRQHLRIRNRHQATAQLGLTARETREWWLPG